MALYKAPVIVRRHLCRPNCLWTGTVTYAVQWCRTSAFCWTAQ